MRSIFPIFIQCLYNATTMMGIRTWSIYQLHGIYLLFAFVAYYTDRKQDISGFTLRHTVVHIGLKFLSRLMNSTSLYWRAIDPIRWRCHGNLRAGHWVRGRKTSSRGWYVHLVFMGPRTGHVSRACLWYPWLEASVGCLCCTWTYFLRWLVVSLSSRIQIHLVSVALKFPPDRGRSG